MPEVAVACPECGVRAVVLPCPLADRVIDGGEGQCKHRSNPLNCPTLRRLLSIGRQELIESGCDLDHTRAGGKI